MNIDKDGRIVATYAPDETYKRHSEGGFARLKDGRIMLAFSRFIGGGHDDSPSDIVAVYSSDEGNTWSAPSDLIKASMYGVPNIMSVSLLRMANGDLGVLYIVKQETFYNRIMLSRSKDDGASFYMHTECSQLDRKGYYVLNNDRVERLASGRLILPLTYHRGGYSTNDKVYWDGRSFGCFLYSDDDGFTWAEAPDTVYPPFTDTRTGLQEAGVIEIKRGALMSYFRTDKMYQYMSLSFDEGMTWTLPQASRFTGTPSPMKIARDPNSGKLYSVWNPIPNYNDRTVLYGRAGRTPIVYAISEDDGASWGPYKVIEDDPEAGYCYPAIFFTDDNSVLISYGKGGEEGCLSTMTIYKTPVA